jgi:primosomal protein N' (replication factor Y)
VEEYLELTFPDMKIARMDLDTTRSAAKLENLLKSFELGEIDVLVGTQMVTKGLDFDNVGLVCILNADGLLYWPDFRANERAFQLMVQVAGRAGRKTATSKVLVQTYNPDHPVIQDVKDRDFSKFYARELEERRQLLYPPFVRLIKLQLRHKDHKVLNQAVYFLDNYLRPRFGHKINGPASPPVARVRSQYLVDFFIKIPKHSPQRSQMLSYINRSVERMKAEKEFKSVRVVFDVDPV